MNLDRDRKRGTLNPMRKLIIGGGAAIILIIVLMVAFGRKSEAPAVGTETPQGGTQTMFTMADIDAHAFSESCYTVVRGSVYDLTAWIGTHPGGADAILKICGKDGTSAFVGKHGGMEKQENLLVGMKIGTLAQ
jgi:hypothetical protein